MVVLSAAICTKSGKALLSRQFVEMSRMRVEGLLSAFPKLIASEQNAAPGGAASAGKQHTFVETDNVRYVYLPLEQLYLLLITNKGSNIVEDLDTLRLLSKVVPEQLGLGNAATEENVAGRAFELLFAFDEVVASGGYREDVTLHGVRTALEMESHEEKLAVMIRASKMAEAKEAAKRKAQELREKAREEERTRAATGGWKAGGGYGAGTSDRMGGFGSANAAIDDGYRSAAGGAGASSSGYGRDRDRDTGAAAAGSSAAAESAAAAAGSAAASKPKPGAGGMKLGGKKAGGLGGAASGALAGVMAEEGIRDRDMMLTTEEAGAGGAAAAAAGGAQAAVAAARAAAEAASADQASVAIEEKLSVRLTRDGGVESIEVKGMMTLGVVDEAETRLKVAVARGDDKAFSYQNHPNVDKALFTSEGMVALKPTARSFPVATPVSVMRWRYAPSKGDDGAEMVPLMITCWPEEAGGGQINVNLEYTLQRTDLTLQDVVVTLPLGSDDAPRVLNCDGQYKHNTRDNTLAWRIESIGEDNSSGTLEFTIRGKNVDAFFPVQVQFSSADTLCPIAVSAVLNEKAEAGDKPLRYSSTKVLQTDGYVVE